MEENKSWDIFIGFIIVVVLGLVLIFGSFTIINPFERGIVVRIGSINRTIEQGFHWKLPLIESVEKMNVQTQTFSRVDDSALSAASKDLQDVRVATVVNYHFDPIKVRDVYQQFGSMENYYGQVVNPIIYDTVKAVASQYTAEELVTKRAEFNDKAFKALTDRLIEKDITVEKLNIVNLKFSDSFESAIEAKATAVQNAETAKNKLEQVKYEKEQRITQAQGEAEAIRIQAQAIQSQGGAEYVKLKAIEKWSGNGCTSYCGLETSSGLLINAK